MVFSGEEEESGAVMGNGSGEGERLKHPLHNFHFPYLKWGNQRSLRCQKNPENGDDPSMVSPPENRMNRLRIDGGDDGIDAMRERLMFDLKVEAGRMKDAILKKEKENGAGAGGGEGSSAAAAGEKVWNLRTRRGFAGENGKGLKIDEKKPIGSSPLRNGNSGGKLRGGGSPEKKVKFTLSLMKKEIEEDFITMTGQKPHRRPKKRPRNVQKQMDTLFPGMWLSEVNADSYKVPDDVPENNGKR